MKKWNLIIFLTMTLGLMGNWIDINQSPNNELFNCEQQNRSSAQIEFNLNGFELKKIEYDEVEYSIISHPNSGELLEIGMPDLPVFSQALILPDQGTPHLEILSYQKQVFHDVIIYPQENLQFEHEPPQDNFRINEDFYNSKGVYPPEIAWIGDPAIMRDLRILPVTFSPFQYNAAEHSMTVFSNIQVSISTEGSGGVNAKYSQRKMSRAFKELYRNNTLNFDQMGFREEYQIPTILFICNDNTSVINNLNYLTEWKRQKGFNVVVATTSETGTTNVAIKNYIQDAYDNWDNPPDYVNIIGDGTGSFSIATWFSTGGYNGEGDHPYSQLEGNDILADIILGRMTFSSINQLQTVISKILNYEKNPYMGNTAWYNQALITGDPTSSGYSCTAFGKGVKELMLDFEGNFWTDANFTEVYSSPFASDMNDAINDGVLFFAYRGFGGTSGWYYGCTNNGYMMPFLVMPTCNANDWYYSTGNVEGFYLMGSTSTPNGGIGGVGTSTPGTHTPFNNAFAIGVWGGIFRDGIYSMGGSVIKGKYYLWLTFPQFSGSYVVSFSHWNTLMGDGSLELWTRLPQNLEVINDEIIPYGANYYSVAVLDSINNAAEDACVTLYCEEDNYVSTGYCDYSGTVLLDINGAPEGEYTLTVTKHDHIPEIQTVNIEQVDQFVGINDYEIDDTSGNSNGAVNPGESVEFMISLENLGNMNLFDVSAVLSSTHTQVNILNSEVNFGDITAGEIVNSPTGFEVVFASDLLGGMEIPFDLIITDSEDNEWLSWLFVPIEGACLYVSDYSIDGDGVIDPGETEEIYFTLENIGNLASPEIDAVLSCFNNRITIVDSIGNFDSILSGSSGNNASDRFTLTASTAILPGTYIPFIIHLSSSDGYNDQVTINVPIGEPEVTDPLGPDEYGYWCYDDDDIGYPDCPEYEWIEIDPDYNGENGISLNSSWNSDYYAGPGGDTGTFCNITLPDDFRLVFYGEEYEELCISSSGWIAPGHHESGNFMNYPLPGPQGPSPMIAVFWDDLNVIYGDVLWFYDEDLHYLVVQWSRVLNGDTESGETFQVILYDPVYYPTTTGDCKIKMQYLDVNNNNYGSYPSNHGQYCTIGLENHDSQIGLLYTFNDTYPQACKELEDEMALLFTPPPIPPDGPFLNVSSFYPYSGDDNYIEAGETCQVSLELENMGSEIAHNVQVECFINNPFITIIDNSHAYGDILPAEFAALQNAFTLDISENVPDFYNFYLEVAIICDEDSWNWMLPFTAYWENTFFVDQDSIYYELETMQTGSQQFTLTNIGNLPVEFYVRTDEITAPTRDVTGSFVTMDTDSFTPGEQTTWTYTVYNDSEDNEWVSDVWLEFPLGVDVLSATDAVGGSGGDLIWDGTTGTGQFINWHGITVNDWGVLHNSETAIWEVDVQLSTEFAGDMNIGWGVGGDGYGAEPHAVNGNITLLYPLRWINLDTSSGSLDPGEETVITVNFDSSDIEPGSYSGNIVITCDSWDTKIINVVLDVSASDNQDDLLPSSFQLNNNFPNPFNPVTSISFNLPHSSDIGLKVYNIKGQYICTLAEGVYPSGTHSVIWNGTDDKGTSITSGVYLYKLSTENIEITRKMILLK